MQLVHTPHPTAITTSLSTTINKCYRPSPTIGASSADNQPEHGCAPNPPTTSQSHVQAPDTFDGSNPKDLRAFLLQCQITFNSYLQQYSMDTTKVFFAISYLKKMALEWFEQGILEDDPSLTLAWHNSWTEFAKELRTHFGLANPVGSAEIELRHLTMASNARLPKYLVRFNTLASCVGWGEQALHFQFYDGLPE